MRYSQSRLTKLAINAATMTLSLLTMIADCGVTNTSPSAFPTQECPSRLCNREGFGCPGGNDCQPVFVLTRACGECPGRRLDYAVFQLNERIQSGQIEFPEGKETALLDLTAKGSWSSVRLELSSNGKVVDDVKVGSTHR